MQLLSLLQEGVILSQTLQSQLISDLDVLGLGDVALLELTNFHRVSCTEQANLAIVRAQLQYLLNDLLEFSGNQPIDFIEDAQMALIKLSLVPLCQV